MAVSQLGELVLGVPPFDSNGGDAAILARVERDYCRPLSERGLDCHARLVLERPGQALLEVAGRGRADLIVIGKRPTGGSSTSSSAR